MKCAFAAALLSAAQAVDLEYHGASYSSPYGNNHYNYPTHYSSQGYASYNPYSGYSGASYQTGHYHEHQGFSDDSESDIEIVHSASDSYDSSSDFFYSHDDSYNLADGESDDFS